MRFAVPSESALLDAVDGARRAPWVARGLALAALSGDEPIPEAPVGRLQEAALGVHDALGGGALAATADCPACEARVEFAVDPDALRGLGTMAPASGILESGGFSASWHAPTVADLDAAAAADDPAAVLRGRCLRASSPDGPVDVDALPADLRADAERAMADADPLAEVLVAMECPECGSAFDADLDPVGFVWEEVEARAFRTLRDVDALARAYGWSQDQILALSPARRAAYLDIVRGGPS